MPLYPISKTDFVAIIEQMREQWVLDKQAAQAFEQVFPGSEAGMYDNGRLVKGLLKLLQREFTVDEDGHCEITHYCYVLDFGKCGEEYEDAGQLYDRLSLEAENTFTASECIDQLIAVNMEDLERQNFNTGYLSTEDIEKIKGSGKTDAP